MNGLDGEDLAKPEWAGLSRRPVAVAKALPDGDAASAHRAQVRQPERPREAVITLQEFDD